MTPAEVLPYGVESEPTKPCSLCSTVYPVSHFRRGGPGQPWARCVDCRPTGGTREEQRREMSRDTARRRNLKRLYDITPEEYDELRAKQSYRCAICQRPEDELPARQTGRPRLDGKPNAAPMTLHVDHDHDTNAIRGLLCWPCNTGLGCFQDQPDRMSRAIAYVSAGGVQN